MERIEKADIDRYHSFLPQLEYAIGEAHKLSKIKSRQRFLNDNAGSADLHKTIYRAQTGLINLDSHVFKRIVFILRASGVDDLLIDDLKASYEVYYNVNLRFNSKKSAFRGAGYLSRENAEKRMRELSASLEIRLEDLADDNEEQFLEFIDLAVEVPFSNNDARNAITNAYALTLFLGTRRDSTFGKLKDDQYFARLSLAARVGAWVSQYVSQRGTFNMFLTILEKAALSRVRQSVIGLHAIRWHDDHWRKNIGLQSEGKHALKAFEFLTQGQSLGRYNSGFDSTIILNAAHEAVREGANFSDSVRSSLSRDYPVADLIQRADEIPLPGAYLVGSRIAAMVVKARSLVNSNKLDEAAEVIAKAWEYYYAAKSQSDMQRHRLKVVEGLLAQKKTGHSENVFLQEAYDLAIKMGAFHYAAEAATLMGWK